MPSIRKQESDQTTPLLSSKNSTKIKGKHSPGKAVFFLLLNDFFQCFSFFGLQAVLILYLIQVLLFNEDTATIIYHGFMMMFFFSPLFGAFLADVFLGRFKTITYVSVFYIIGNILVSMASVPEFLPMRPISILGIVIIAIAFGTTIPCCNSFGGDQFNPNQSKGLEMFFSMLFLCIKLGKLVGTIVSPLLRAGVHCFGQSTCFPLAFGFPTVLIILSLIGFLIAYPYYKINPASGNIMYDVIKCIIHAVVQKFKKRNEGLKKQHWLDYADDKYDTQMISDVKCLFSILTMFFPVPFYWALWGQQGSRWTLQATQLNNSIGNYKIQPDQMQVTNAILGIFIIPFLDYVIYPLLNKCNLLNRPLQRMAVGGLLVTFSFVTAGFLQLSIERSLNTYDVENYMNFDIKELPLQKLQPYNINCSLYKLSNTSLESETNQVIKCLYNNETTLFVQPDDKLINSTNFKNLHINKRNNEILYNFTSISHNNDTKEFLQLASVSYSSLSILLQLPQYILLTCGEMMFVITVTGFAYSQAPKSMKTVLPALLLVNNGIGNVIVMIITDISIFQRQPHLPKKMDDYKIGLMSEYCISSYEFFFYAVMLAIVIFIFAMLARNYRYKEENEK